MTCDSQNVIYVIRCHGCNEIYIGKTELKLKRRMNLHRSQIKQKHNRTIPLSAHLENCGKNEYSVFPIYKIDSNEKNLLAEKENLFIKKFMPKLNSKV